jgi:hypothetical protein
MGVCFLKSHEQDGSELFDQAAHTAAALRDGEAFIAIPYGCLDEIIQKPKFKTPLKEDFPFERRTIFGMSMPVHRDAFRRGQQTPGSSSHMTNGAGGAVAAGADGGGAQPQYGAGFGGLGGRPDESLSDESYDDGRPVYRC